MNAPAKTVIQPPKEWDRTSVTLLRELWGRLETARRASNATRPPPDRQNRDEFIASLLAYALSEMEAEWLRKGHPIPAATPEAP